ncbi:ABC transporter ATP-binding protein [Chryseobacterium populi]|uniref:ABC-type transport system involved in resistance to organic solvents, ATPase component n=1 Tax=Chryseobacterium populi TaxID=1144316 RepID=J2KER5_9FLAO|nr:ATP-binding cassette domain-containing protein [Chryseobacterium populi]EJL71623.1 ABC-type transport system involved in resistance to organic solvents, ATPase component [Chryseobacterium populi]
MENREKFTAKHNELQNCKKLIEFKNVYKSYGSNKVLNGISFTIKRGENLVILGKSGSGKSVTVKCLVGLTKVDKGEIFISGKDITKLDEEGLNRIRMKIGFLFQNGALYDSMTVRENLVFTLQHNNKMLTEQEIETAVKEALQNVGLEEAIDLLPAELSGGMRKRIGLARALIIKPEIIIYDEPTGGLDTITAREIIGLIRNIKLKYNTSSIIITHDLTCAKYTGDRVIVLKDGLIKAEGSYKGIENNADNWVRSFFEK